MRYPVSSLSLGELERQYVLEALDSGWISSLGSFITRFESDFAGFCDVRHAVAVSNGTTALFLSLKALGIGRGDEVIVPALTFAAVPAAVVEAGAEPVVVDVDPENWCLDPGLVEKATTPRTKAILVVHSYGHPADMDPILSFARERGLAVVEDCAEAHGARYKGRVVGSMGELGAFSLYGNKIITTGEGGFVVGNDDGLISRARFLKDHAMDPERRYYHTEVGYNFRLTNLQAAVGLAQLSRIRELIAAREALLETYRKELGHLGRVRLNPRMPWAEPVNWMVCALLESADESGREKVMKGLREKGIDTRPFFVTIPEMPPYRSCRVVGRSGPRAEVAERLSRIGLNLPCYVGMLDSDVEFIARSFEEELVRAGIL